MEDEDEDDEEEGVALNNEVNSDSILSCDFSFRLMVVELPSSKMIHTQGSR